MGPLKGIRILDLTRILAGPFATQILADLGAEVIKVERPGTGDDSRSWGPPYIKNAAGEETADSTYFACCNRGKKSLAIDIATAQGQQRVRALLESCDVLVENYKTCDLDRYGLGYEQLKAIKPDLIYCSITGFGHTGPYAKRAGYDPIAQAMSGLMSVTGEPEDMPGTSPQRVGVAVIDLMTAHYAVIGILAALHHRQQTGEGQQIDLALLDVGLASMANIASAYLGAGSVAKRNGGVHPSVLPSQVFACKDGHVFVVAANDGQFGKLCDIGGRPELSKDPRFATNSLRVKNIAAITPLLEEMFANRTMADWTENLAKVGVPCGPIYSIDQAFEDPQVKAREMKFEMAYAPAGKLAMVASPLKLSATPVQYKRPPPMLGEHDGEFTQPISSKSTPT